MRRALLILAMLAAPAFGQAPPSPAPAASPAKAVVASRPSYPSGSVVFVDAAGSTTTWPLQFAVVGRPNEPKATLDGGTGVIYPALPDGSYFVAVTASAPKEGSPPSVDTAVVAVTVGAAPAPPPVVTPPVVTPAVTPPTVPTAVGNMRVLLLYDSGAAMTASQRNVLFSTTSVVPYLNAKCLKGVDGRAGWRFWDPTTPLQGDAAEWRDLVNKAKAEATAMPKIVVFAGNTVAGSRMVTSEADTLSYLQSLGGK